MPLPEPDKLRIICYPDPVLKRTCSPVEQFDDRFRAVAERMIQLMLDNKGVGLAAPQVGLLLRFFVCNSTGEPEDSLICVNPKFLELEGVAELEEGCLSIPGVNVTRRRSTKAVIEMQDVEGKRLQSTGEDLLARVWQHESDHLDGRLITDNMSTSDEIANRYAIKQLKEEFARKSRRSAVRP